MKRLKIAGAVLLAMALSSCGKTPVGCNDLSTAATSDLIAQHLKSGFTNTEARNALEFAIKVPADFGKLLTIEQPVIETVSQAPDGNSATCAAHVEATASPEIQKSAMNLKGSEARVRAMLELANRSTAGDEVGDDGYFQFASRRLIGTVKVLKEYSEVSPPGSFLPGDKYHGTLKYVLTRGTGEERRWAITGDAVAPKWAQALTFYVQFDEWMTERTSAAERKQLYGAFDVVSIKKYESCGEEAICLTTERAKQVVMNGAALEKGDRELLDTAVKSGSNVCLTGVEKHDGRLHAAGIAKSCQ